MSGFNPKNYKHFIWGENNISQKEQQTFVIKLDDPACSVRFNYSKGAFASFDNFYQNIADVQFFNGDRPDKNTVKTILIDVWNFICLEERRLDEDLYNNI